MRPLAVATALAAAATVFSSAHDFSASESVLSVDGAIVRSRLSLNALELPDVDVNGDQRISYDELDRAIERIFKTIKQHYFVGAPEPPSAIVAERNAIIDDHVLQIDIRYTFSHSVGLLDLTSTLDGVLGATHQHVASLKVGGDFQRAVLDSAQPTAHFDARRVTPVRVAMVVAAFLGLVGLGIVRRRRSRPS